MLDILYQLYKGIATYIKIWVNKLLIQQSKAARTEERKIINEKTSVEFASINSRLDFRF